MVLARAEADMIWDIAIYSGNQYIGIAPVKFDSQAAAQWWIDNEADKSLNWRYVAAPIAVYTLTECQEIWPAK